MAFGVDDAIGLGLSSLAKGGLDYSQALIGDYFGRKQRAKQSKLSYEMANYEAALNYQYSQLYNEQNYELAQRYAQNSAKWSVQGLRNAGLNPILAAGGGYNPNLGSAGTTSDTSVDMPSMSANPTMSGGSLSEILGTLSNVRETNSRVKLNDAQKPLIEANTAKSAADAELIQANADAVRAKTVSEAVRLLMDVQRNGDKGSMGTLSHMFGNLDWRNRRNNNDISRAAETIFQQIVNHGKISTAKEMISPMAGESLRHRLYNTPVQHNARTILDSARKIDKRSRRLSDWLSHGNWSR